MTKLKVVGANVDDDLDTETFTLLNEEKDECELILSRKKHPKTFNYLMDCFRDECYVDRNKLFLEKRGDGK